MNVGQLKELLKQYDNKVEIVVDGYENGLDIVDSSNVAHIAMKSHNHWWEGEFTNLYHKTQLTKEALILYAKRRKLED